MSDARWFEVHADIEAAIHHFRQSVELYRKGGFDAPGLNGYQAEMALMHNYDSFRVREVSRTVEAAATLASGLQAEILAFKNIIDPPGGECRE